MRRSVRAPIAPLITVLMALLACACQPKQHSSPHSGSAWDARLVSLGHGAPFADFDATFASVLPGEGWGSYETYTSRLGRVFGQPFDFAWVVDGAARIWFERPQEREIDFYAVCMPLPNPRQRQELVLTIGGREIGRTWLEEDWQRIRIPLPGTAIGRGWKAMRLSFRYAVSPSELGEGQDHRRLSAAFRRVAVVPRQVEDPATLFDNSRIDGERLTLARGSSVTLPLPAASEATLYPARLAAENDRRGCVLRFGLARGGEIWRGTSAEANRTAAVAFSTPAGVPSRLRISLEDCGYDALEVPLTRKLLSLTRTKARSRARPHVFIYMIDTLRADALTVYGSARRTSPHLEEFARDAVTYHHVWSPSAWTLPSVVSVMTGVYPDRHQVSLGLPELNSENLPTLAERLLAHGYATVGISQSFIVSQRFGLHLGFDDFYLSDQLGGHQLRSQEVRSYLLQWLLHRWDGERPIFAFLHTVDPHAPYLPAPYGQQFAQGIPQTLSEDQYAPDVFAAKRYAPSSAEVKQLRALYDGEVAWADRELGRFLDMLRHLGLYDDSLIVVTSDHGEEFGEHGGFDHGRAMYEEMLQVPLLVKYPGSEAAGTHVEARPSTVDVLPTILWWAGMAVSDEALDGRVLPPFESADRRFTYAEVKTLPAKNLAAVHYRAIRAGDVKCIESVSGNDQYHRKVPRWLGFDLAEDPAEQRPIPASDARLERCSQTLGRWIESRKKSRTGASSSLQELDEATLQRLRAVGYVE